MADEVWRKSSRCQEGTSCVEVAAGKSSRCVSNNHCVEVAFSSSVKVRDRYGRVIEVDPRSWQLFIDGVCRG